MASTLAFVRHSFVCILVFCSFFQTPLPAQNLQPGAIGTVAGSAGYGFSGDQGSAAIAKLDTVYAVAADVRGNIYIADSWNHRVRMVSRDGKIATIAGTGAEGYSGDLGPAIASRLSCPRGIAVDVNGNVYVSDTGNSRVRKITTDGTISTIAGTGVAGYSGDGSEAGAAQLQNPRGLALDGKGNLFIADSWNFRVRRVAKDGTITTVAGSGVEGFAGDGGKATEARLGLVTGLAVDKDSALLIADTSNHRVRRVSSAGTIATVAGAGTCGDAGDNGKATDAQFRYPRGVAVDSQGNIYVADAGNHRIRRIAPDGTIKTVSGTGSPGSGGDLGAAAAATLNVPYAISVDPRGNVYVADALNYRVRKARFETVTERPVVPKGGVVSAASGQHPVSGGSLISIYGQYLAGGLTVGDEVPVGRAVGGVTVSVAGKEIPVLFVSPGQINAQMPAGVAPGTAPLKVSFGGVESDAVDVDVAQAAPGVFLYGQNRAIVVNQDYKLNSPDAPADRNSWIVIYGTGQGPVTNTPADGAAAPGSPLAQTPTAPEVTIGDAKANVYFSGLAPTFVGLWQINAQVPADAPQGSAVELKVTMAGNTSAPALVSIR